MKKERIKWLILAVLAGVVLILLGLYAWVSSRRQMAQTAAESVIRPLRSFLSACSAAIPFSVMELLYTLLGLGVTAFLTVTVVQVVRQAGGWKGKLLLAGRRAAAAALAALYIANGSLWLWGLEYQTYSFSQREGFSVSGVTEDQLYEATVYFVDSANALADAIPRDEAGQFRADRETCFSQAPQVYDGLQKLFPSLDGPVRRPKEMRMYSEIMSRMGFSGVYFCFTGESNINIDQAPSFIPFTIAHELAHQKGVASEQECNFLGVAAGLTCGIPEYQYSCCLAGTVHLMNALYKASPDRWREVQERLSAPVQADLAENNRFWKSKETRVTEVSEKAYDAYLKANGQELGIQSYGACVDLLTAFYLQYCKEPKK